jgi:hypothetical protein
LTLLTSPFTQLLGAGAGAVPAAIHGMAALLYLFIGAIGLHLGWRLLTTMSLIAIGCGNWLCIFYRAKTPDSPRSYFLRTMPDIHQIFFELRNSARSSRCR